MDMDMNMRDAQGVAAAAGDCCGPLAAWSELLTAVASVAAAGLRRATSM
jgi:hypothetical protein